MTTKVEANGVVLGVEHFGDAATPLVLLAARESSANDRRLRHPYRYS
jgi:hypothetical protein